jgi:hypothetical protein
MSKLKQCLGSNHQLVISAMLFVAALGCAGDTVELESVSVHDSTGITIVENASPVWAEDERWRLSDEPVLTIGVLEGPEEYTLFRAHTALRLDNGEIVVTNGGTHQLRFYDSTGAFVRAVGREGEGPGEFKLLGRMWRLGSDSLIVLDARLMRMTVLGTQGEFGRTFKLHQAPGISWSSPRGPLADRSLLAVAGVTGPGEPKKGLSRGAALYCRYDLDGVFIDTLVSRPGYESYIAAVAGHPASFGPPWPRSPAFAVSGDDWYYGSSDTWEIEVYSATGVLKRLIRLAMPNYPVTAENIEAYRRSSLESDSREPEAMRRILADIPFPETFPAYRSFLVDDERNLWVAEYRRWPRWAVFDPEGRFLGNVPTPRNGRVTHIGSDFVLGVWRDEMDVEQLRVYRLIKP